MTYIRNQNTRIGSFPWLRWLKAPSRQNPESGPLTHHSPRSTPSHSLAFIHSWIYRFVEPTAGSHSCRDVEHRPCPGPSQSGRRQQQLSGACVLKRGKSRPLRSCRLIRDRCARRQLREASDRVYRVDWAYKSSITHHRGKSSLLARGSVVSLQRPAATFLGLWTSSILKYS